MTVPIQPLSDAELALGRSESQQAADVLKEAYRKLRTAYEDQRAELRKAHGVLATHGIFSVPDRSIARSIAWLQRHLQTCCDPDCTGCKVCRCGALTLAYGFEDHLCYNCRHPPSD